MGIGFGFLLGMEGLLEFSALADCIFAFSAFLRAQVCLRGSHGCIFSQGVYFGFFAGFL
jgi:hypothetical protein